MRNRWKTQDCSLWRRQQKWSLECGGEGPCVRIFENPSCERRIRPHRVTGEAERGPEELRLNGVGPGQRCLRDAVPGRSSPWPLPTRLLNAVCVLGGGEFIVRPSILK